MKLFSQLISRSAGRLAALLGLSACLMSATALAQNAESTLDTVKARGKLIVGVQTVGAPFGYLNAQGENVGFDVDLARYIAGKLGVDVEFKPVTSANRIPLLASKAIDLAAASITVTPERMQAIDFSTPYVLMGGKLLVKKDSGIENLKDLAGKPVAFAQGGSSLQEVQRQVPDIEPLVFSEGPLAAQAVAQGKAVAMAADGSQLYYFAQKYPNLTVVGEAWPAKPLAIGIRQNDSQWRHAINFVLAEFWRDGSYAKAYETHLGVAPPADFSVSPWGL